MGSSAAPLVVARHTPILVDHRQFRGAPPIDQALLGVSLLLGLIHAWMGRSSMNPDGISYLDVGDAFVRRNWAGAINGWWSPLYAWALGVLVNVVKPTPRWEFTLVQAANFVVFVLALFAFRFLLRSILIFMEAGLENLGGRKHLPIWCIELIAYALFLWISLEVLTIYDVSPDLAVSACIYLITGGVLRLRLRPTLRRAAILGAYLGIGYWTKAILLPFGVMALCFAFLWVRERHWRKRLAQAALIFACLSAPLILSLSLKKGRFTFGDSGRVNYAWAMSDVGTRNWQGEISGAGAPIHPTRLISRNPPVFEFDGPVIGTYPPWTDPSYWNEGLRVHFQILRQARVLAVTVQSEARLLLRSQPPLLVGIISFALLSGTAGLTMMRRLWPLLLMQVGGMAAYVPIIENDRYIGGFVLAFFLLLFTCVQVLESDRKSAAYVAIGVFVAILLSTLDLTVRIATNHVAIAGNQPTSTAEHIAAAEGLWALGIHPGDKVAVIGDGTGAYWARLAKVRIVAEIMGMGHGAEHFWQSPEETRQKIYGILAGTHAQVVVGGCSDQAARDGWQRISGTNFCVRGLTAPTSLKIMEVGVSPSLDSKRIPDLTSIAN